MPSCVCCCSHSLPVSFLVWRHLLVLLLYYIYTVFMTFRVSVATCWKSSFYFECEWNLRLFILVIFFLFIHNTTVRYSYMNAKLVWLNGCTFCTTVVCCKTFIAYMTDTFFDKQTWYCAFEIYMLIYMFILFCM
jgi:hypothetical protein